MNKKKLEKVAMVVGPIVLFILVLLVVLSFHKDSETITIEDNPKVEEKVDVFENHSDMSEDEIRELVEQKRLVLQNFFKDLKFYTVSEVADGYSLEDDETYLAIGESYLETLKSLLIGDAYSMFWDHLKEVASKPTIDLKERIYVGERDLFVNLFLNSAIATEGMNREKITLLNATNEKIEVYVSIQYCVENIYDVCQRDERYSFILEYVSDTWLISEFTKVVN